jgi:hypothetical protein
MRASVSKLVEPEILLSNKIALLGSAKRRPSPFGHSPNDLSTAFEKVRAGA